MERMPFTNFEDLNRAANFKLKEAMMNERSKRWSKVVQNYRSLLSLICLDNFPPSFEPPDGYGMLLYELYYSLGWALQQVGEHAKAVKAYTKSINSVSIPKNGCLAGCHANSCLMTPVYAKRAFAYAKTGDLKGALKDAEKTVVLDSRNPDVYCIRALVRNSRGEELLALQDVVKSLSLNSSHIASLIIRGTLQAPVVISDWPGSEAMAPNKDHEKAIKINPDSQNFLSVTSMDNPDVNRFYDRFLYSLNVPHTVNIINMMPKTKEKTKEASSTRQNLRKHFQLPAIQKCPSDWCIACVSERHTIHTCRKPDSRTSKPSLQGKGYESPLKFMQHGAGDVNGGNSSAKASSFRCGSTISYPSFAAQRRREYGNTLRRHLNEARPKTTKEILANLYKSLQKRNQQTRPVTCHETSMRRRTDLDGGILRSSISLDDVSAGTTRKLKDIHLSSATSQGSKGTPATKSQSTEITVQTSANDSRNSYFGASGSQLRTLSACKPLSRSQSAGTKSSSSRGSSFAVFQPINVKDAPRMYYRPWMGDKLPVAEIPPRKPTPAFY